MHLTKLTHSEVKNLEHKIGNIERFKLRYKTGPPSRLDIFKDVKTRNKDIYVANKDGSGAENTGETLY